MLLVALLAIGMSFLVPEVRAFLGLKDGGRDGDTVIVGPGDTFGRQVSKTSIAPKDQGRTSAGKLPGEVKQYKSIVVDSLDRPVAGVRVICSTCENQQTHTNDRGEFVLAKRYQETDVFRQESVSFAKDDKTISLHLDWREATPIKF